MGISQKRKKDANSLARWVGDFEQSSENTSEIDPNCPIDVAAGCQLVQFQWLPGDKLLHYDVPSMKLQNQTLSDLPPISLLKTSTTAVISTANVQHRIKPFNIQYH